MFYYYFWQTWFLFDLDHVWEIKSCCELWQKSWGFVTLCKLTFPSSACELMRGFLMLFLAPRSWRAIRGWRRERDREERETAGGEGWRAAENEEEVGMERTGRGEEEKEERRRRRWSVVDGICMRGKGCGGWGVPMQTSAAAASTQSYPPPPPSAPPPPQPMRALNRDQTVRKNRRESSAILSAQAGTTFFHLPFVWFLHYRSDDH